MFQVTIRELLLVTVIVAVRAAWCADHRIMADRIRSQIERRTVVYNQYVQLTGRGAFIEPGPPEHVEWITRYPDWWPTGPPPVPRRRP